MFQQGQSDSRFHELTGLGFLDFWMQSIYAYAASKKESTHDENRPQLSPPIFIVGTHRDSSSSTDPRERMRQVSTIPNKKQKQKTKKWFYKE